MLFRNIKNNGAGGIAPIIRYITYIHIVDISGELEGASNESIVK